MPGPPRTDAASAVGTLQRVLKPRGTDAERNRQFPVQVNADLRISQLHIATRRTPRCLRISRANHIEKN